MKGGDGATISPGWMDATGVVVCLGLSGLIYLGAVRPPMAVAAEREVESAELEKRTAILDSYNDTAARMEQRLLQALDAVSQSDIKLEHTSQLNRRLARLGDLASQCRLAIDEMQVGDITADSDYQTVPLTLRGRGNFRSAAIFLHELQGALPDTTVRAFTLSGNPQDATAPPGFVFDLTWFAAPANSQ